MKTKTLKQQAHDWWCDISDAETEKLIAKYDLRKPIKKDEIKKVWMIETSQIKSDSVKDKRSEAMAWWNNLSSLGKTQICDTHTELIGSVRRWETLTGSEIQAIWETESGDEAVAHESNNVNPLLKFRCSDEENRYRVELIAELIDMHENPDNSNKAFKDAIIGGAREKGYGNGRNLAGLGHLF